MTGDQDISVALKELILQVNVNTDEKLRVIEETIRQVADELQRVVIRLEVLEPKPEVVEETSSELDKAKIQG
jgi:hypothetical protein